MINSKFVNIIVNYQKFTIKIRQTEDNQYKSTVSKNDFYKRHNVKTYCLDKKVDISSISPYDVSYQISENFVLIGGFKLKGGGVCQSTSKVDVQSPNRRNHLSIIDRKQFI